MLYQETSETITQKFNKTSWFANLSQSPFLKWYFVLCILYTIFLTIDYNFMLSQEVYIKSVGGNNLHGDKLESIIKNFKSNFWSSIALTPIAIIAQILLVSFCLMMGFILRDIKIPFVSLVVMVAKALVVFPVTDILLSLGLIATRKIQTIEEAQKPDWHSLMYFFNREEISKWLIYPFKTINLAEITFLIILYYQLKFFSKEKSIDKPLFSTALFAYILGLIFWIVFVLFWQMAA